MPTELDQNTSLKLQMLENWRHDVRTSLNGALGLAQALASALKNTSASTQSEALASSIAACLDFQTNMIDALVENNQIERIFCLKTTIEKAIHLVMPRVLLKNLIVDFHWDNALPIWVQGNALSLFQIVHELLTNAIKFTGEGKITIRFHMENKQDHQFILCGDISDTGIGIADHEKSAVFERFYRIPSDQSGSGIGLSQVQHSIQSLNGWCEIQNNARRGTTFLFYLPLAECREHVVSTIDLSNKRFDGVNILLIEDHPVTLIAIKQALFELGCGVEVAMNGESALIQMQYKKFDLILMDLHLPDMCGSDLLNQIKINTPVIGITADKKRGEKMEVFSNLSVILEKPISSSLLIEALNNHIETVK